MSVLRWTINRYDLAQIQIWQTCSDRGHIYGIDPDEDASNNVLLICMIYLINTSDFKVKVKSGDCLDLQAVCALFVPSG